MEFDNLFMYLPGSKVIPMTNADPFLEFQTQAAHIS